MSHMLKVKNVNDYSAYLGHSAQHRWVSVIDYAEVTPIRHCLCNYSVYGLFLRDDILIDLTYGLENTTTTRERSFVWLPDR